MIPAGFYDYGVGPSGHDIPLNPQQLRDAAVAPNLRLGALGCGDVQVRQLRGVGEVVSSPLVAAAALAGSAVGGAMIGYVAGDGSRAAYRGAGFAAGVVGVADGIATFRDSKPLGVGLAVFGLAAVTWAIWDRRRGRR